MSQIIVSPSEQRRFADDLDGLVSDLRDRQRRLESGVENLGQSWQDQKYASFERAFETAGLQLTMFFNMSERYIEYLRRKADAGDRYLGRG